MAYQVLARKWRPKKFADLVGQEHVVKALANALDKGRLHHAYLLTGTRGVGKTTIARILAKSLNCPQAVAGEPCGVCDSCTQIDAGRYVDVLEIDAASNTGIDNIREVLENAQYAPTLGRYKVYIIDEVHMLSKSAFNAMLKTLEEPPAHVKFILATTDPHKVPVTVLSRCLQFVLRNLNAQQVRAHLAHVLQSENIAYEDTALQLLGRAAMGSMRDALSLLDQAIAMGAGRVGEANVRQMIGAVDHSHLYDVLAALAAGDGRALMAEAEYMAARVIGFGNALSELALLLQRLALLQAVPGAVAADDPEYGRLQALAQTLSGEQIQLYYQCAIRGQHDLSLAPDEYAGFVMTLLRMLAFAPLAAAAHPSQGRIVGSQLQDAAPVPAAAPLPAPLSVAAVAAETALPGERLPESLPPMATDIAAMPDTKAMPEPESVPLSPPHAGNADGTETVALAAAVLVESAPLADVLPEDDVPPWLPLPTAPETVSEPPLAQAEVRAAAKQEAHTADGCTPPLAAAPETAAAAQHPPEPPTAALPPLNADNWPQIVAALAPKLGAIQMFAQHSAVAALDTEAGLLTLALAAEGEITADKARLQRLGEVLSSSYAIPIRVQTRAWQAESGLETQMMRRQRLQQEAREQARQCLEADAAATAIRHAFDAEWLPESLVLLGDTAPGAA